APPRSALSLHDALPISTPARAGTTSARSVIYAARRVYPRSRGDHRPRTTRDARRSGLPPLARGPLPGDPARGMGVRSTPARAGRSEEHTSELQSRENLV